MKMSISVKKGQKAYDFVKELKISQYITGMGHYINIFDRNSNVGSIKICSSHIHYRVL